MNNKMYLILCAFLYFATICIANETIDLSPQLGNVKPTCTNCESAETLSKEACQLKKFIQVFFADSIFQREHVKFPLILQYWVELEYNGEYLDRQDTIHIWKNNYQILTLDTRSEIKICKKENNNPYVVVSIPDTALEAELYFSKKKNTYFLLKINVSGDASPFL